MNFIVFADSFAMKTEESDPIYIENGKVLLVSTPWKLINHRILRKCAHFHLSSNINSKVPMPWRHIWNKYIFRNQFNNQDVLCVIFNAHFYEMIYAGTIEYLRRHYRNCKIVLRFSDKYEYFRRNYRHFPSVDVLNKTFDAVYTYNDYDIEKYGFWRSGSLVRDFSYVSDDESLPKTDLFFVGQEKGRIDELHRVFLFCKNHDISCDFHIVGVPEEKCLYPDDIKYNQVMDYDDVLKHAKRSNCILNLVQEHGSGLSRRDYEAFGMNKLLLTNNTYIKKSELYTREQVIFIDELSDRVEDIKLGFAGRNNFSEVYSSSNLYKRMEKQLLAGKENI